MTFYAQTVTGKIEAAALGQTLMHEHILCDLRNPATADAPTAWQPLTWETRFQIDYFSNRHQPNMLLDDDAVAMHELTLFKEAGGSTIVELTIGGIHPQPERLAALSRQTGAQIIFGTGWYVDAYLTTDIRQSKVDALAATMVTHLREGAWGTQIRAGIIGEIGCSWPLLASERRLLEAAARAQQATGAAITIHPGRHPDAPAEIADILEQAGADLERTVIGHMDRTIFDLDRLLALLHRGVVLEWDFFGIETSQYWMEGVDIDLPTDYMRLDLIKELSSRGFAEKLAISHDICTRTRLCSHGGHGYRHILLNIVPMMRRRGFSEELIAQLLVQTPARLLAYLPEGELPNGGPREGELL